MISNTGTEKNMLSMNDEGLKMEIKIEIKVNQTLEDAFLQHLRNIAAGMMREDMREMEELIDHCERTKAEDWKAEAKQELALFLLFRAGFQSAAGYRAEDFEA